MSYLSYAAQHLDSDDLLLPEKITLHVNYLEAHPEIAFVYGRTLCFFDDERTVTWKDPHPLNLLARSGNLIDDLLKYGNFENVLEIASSGPEHLLEQTVLGIPAFNAWFFRRGVFERIGTFDAVFRIIAYREFMIRLALAGIIYARTDHLLYQYRQQARSMMISGNETNSTIIIEEHLKMTDCFLRKTGMPEKAKQYFRKMRTRDTLSMPISHLYKREVGRAWFYAREGIWSDWGWPLKLASRAFHRLTHSGLGKISNA